MGDWQKELRFDPFSVLLSSRNEMLRYFVKRDLLGEKVAPIETFWKSAHVLRLISKQQEDGSWRYHGGKAHVRSEENYNQLETYRVLGQLIEKYGLTRKHPSMRKATNFLFNFQKDEGDFRGIYGNQYTPNYTAAIMELIIKAGYEEDPRIERGFKWLLSIRQNDGGWALPLRAIQAKGSLIQALKKPEPISPDKSKPFSHCITGVVLRAFAAHRKYRKTEEAKVAGELLKSRFFQPDKYPDRKAVDFWTKFSFPFWFTDLLSALDSLSRCGFTRDDPQIEVAFEWLRDKQQENGLWKLSLLKDKSIEDLPLWISLTVCRVFKRFYT